MCNLTLWKNINMVPMIFLVLLLKSYDHKFTNSFDWWIRFCSPKENSNSKLDLIIFLPYLGLAVGCAIVWMCLCVFSPLFVHTVFVCLLHLADCGLGLHQTHCQGKKRGTWNRNVFSDLSYGWRHLLSEPVRYLALPLPWMLTQVYRGPYWKH